MFAEHIDKIKKIVDEKFCEKILRKSENDSNIEVSNVLIRTATNKGDNYMSDMFRVTVEYKHKGKKSIIVKVVPMAEGVHQDIVTISRS